MIVTRNQGIIATTPELVKDAQAGGYVQCETFSNEFAKYGGRCPFWINPQTSAMIQKQGGGYYTCSNCHRSHNMMQHLPWHGVTEGQISDQARREWAAGGGTRIGIPMRDQGQIGEQVIRSLGQGNTAFTQRYGPITQWSEVYNSPLDGQTREWGIEVKAIGADAMHHRFVAGSPSTKSNKDQAAAQAGLKGVLGALVILDFRRSLAEVYVKEHLLSRGIGNFRSTEGEGQHFLASVPFKNPMLDPHDPTPIAHDMPF